MSARLESGLLLTARILVLMLPLCLLGGRVAGEAALSLIALLFVARSVLARDWAWPRTVWYKVDEGLSGPFDGLRAGIFIAKLMFPVVLGAFLWQAWQRPAKKLLLVALTALMVGAVFVSGERMALLLSLAGLALAAHE